MTFAYSLEKGSSCPRNLLEAKVGGTIQPNSLLARAPAKWIQDLVYPSPIGGLNLSPPFPGESVQPPGYEDPPSSPPEPGPLHLPFNINWIKWLNRSQTVGARTQRSTHLIRLQSLWLTLLLLAPHIPPPVAQWASFKRAGKHLGYCLACL